MQEYNCCTPKSNPHALWDKDMARFTLSNFLYSSISPPSSLWSEATQTSFNSHGLFSFLSATCPVLDLIDLIFKETGFII